MTKKKMRNMLFSEFLNENVQTVWKASGVSFSKAWKRVRAAAEEQQEEVPAPEEVPAGGGSELGGSELDKYADDGGQNTDQGQFNDDQEGEEGQPDDTEQEEPEDPDHMGIIRVVAGAHLVYKRQEEEGTFKELWVYPITIDDTGQGGGKIRNELQVRRNILSGTDIIPGKQRSKDSSQKLEISTIGNAQFISISGLPN